MGKGDTGKGCREMEGTIPRKKSSTDTNRKNQQREENTRSTKQLNHHLLNLFELYITEAAGKGPLCILFACAKQAKQSDNINNTGKKMIDLLC